MKWTRHQICMLTVLLLESKKYRAIPWGVKIKWTISPFLGFWSEKPSKNHETYFFWKFIVLAFFWWFFHNFWMIFHNFMALRKKVWFLLWDSFYMYVYPRYPDEIPKNMTLVDLILDFECHEAIFCCVPIPIKYACIRPGDYIHK